MQDNYMLEKNFGGCDTNIDLSQFEARFWGHIEKDENEMSKKPMHTKSNNSSLGRVLNPPM